MSNLGNIVDARKNHTEIMEQHLNNHHSADDPNYKNIEPELTTKVSKGQIVGTEVNYTSYTDKFTEYTIREYGGETSRTTTIKDAIERLANQFGKPENNENSRTNDPVKSIDEFFNTLGKLASPAGDNNISTQVVREGQNLSLTFRELSKGMQLIKYDAESKISDSVREINGIIQNIQSLNSTISQSENGSPAKAVQQGRQTSFINTLAGYMDITVKDNDDGSRQVQTGNGETIAGDAIGQLSYEKSDTFERFRNEAKFDSIQLKQFRTIHDEKPYFTTELASKTAKDKKAETSLNKGELKGLLQIRDELIDDKIEVLDNLAQTLADKVNAVHNKGSGKPPADEYVGTALTSLSDTTRWSGTFRVAAVDKDGGAIARIKDNTYLTPLDINLDKLRDENGSEGIDVETILGEINQHFNKAPTIHTAELNNIRDIKMVGASQIENSPTKFKFNLELENQSAYDSQVQVTDVVVKDSGGNPVAGAASNYNSTFTSEAGSKSRTEQDITLDLGAGSAGPYTVEVTTEVLSDDGKLETGTINYQINVSGDKDVINKRYQPKSASGDASVNTPDRTHSYLKASLVDESGKEITDKSKQGYIKISGMKDYHVVLQDMDSEEIGKPNLGLGNSKPASNKGLGHYFGLNNFFTTDEDNKTTAFDMSVEKQIVSQPSLISVGKVTQLKPKQVHVPEGHQKATNTLNFDTTNPQDGDSLTINGVGFTFKNTASNNDEIKIGADIDETIDNILSTLNAENTYTAGAVNRADYSREGNTIKITYKAPGEDGNSFGFGFSLSAGAQASIGDSTMQASDTGSLQDGSNHMITKNIEQYGMELTEADNSVTNMLSELSSELVEFKAAGSLLNAETTLHSYASSFMNECMRSYNFYKIQSKGYQETFDRFNKSYQEKSRPDANDELYQIIEETQILQRMDKLFKLVRQANEMIFEVL